MISIPKDSPLLPLIDELETIKDKPALRQWYRKLTKYSTVYDTNMKIRREIESLDEGGLKPLSMYKDTANAIFVSIVMEPQHKGRDEGSLTTKIVKHNVQAKIDKIEEKAQEVASDLALPMVGLLVLFLAAQVIGGSHGPSRNHRFV